MKYRLIPGMVIGKLTLIEMLPQIEKGRTRWLCECECGKRVAKSRVVLTNPRLVHRCDECFATSQGAYSSLRVALGLPKNQWDKP